jgi:hypothetical protein
MNQRVILYLFFAVAVFGCSTDKYGPGVKAVQELVHADKITVDEAATSDKQNTKIKYWEIYLESGNIIESKTYENNMNDLSSIVAMKFFENANEEEFNEKNAIKIIIKRKQPKILVNENLYYFDSLSLISHAMNYCVNVCSCFINRDYNHLFELCNIKLLEHLKDDKSKFVKEFEDLDTRMGKATLYNIIGFEIKKDKYVEKKVNVVHFKVELLRGTILSKLDIDLGLEEGTDGILNLELQK